MFKPKKKTKGKVFVGNVNNVKENEGVQSEMSSEMISMFLTLQEKLNSPVFNGGFDRLLHKVENIEENQKQTSETVKSLNKLIFEPDEGLYSRIKKVEGVNIIELQKISSAQEKFKEDMGEIKLAVSASNTTAKDVQELKVRVDALTVWRSELARKMWLLVPVVVALMGKIGWDVIVSHVTIK